uniref:Uncharacterized protein n=2 Tax=Chenopodium quinoa TaxID=63459 RepID=A0A803MJS1_CHEQI
MNVEHLVDFLRIYYLPSKLREVGQNYNTTEHIKYPMTAKELKAAGVTFVAIDGDKQLDITYSKGKLKIPKLFIQDITEAIFRNIIFFEQSHYHLDSYFIDYMIFFDDLIDSPEDVQILVKSNIIEHWLGTDEQVATVINSIVKHISIYSRNFYYNEVCHKLIAFASKKRNKWKAILRRNYFNHPWSITSVIYLVILLILTVLQVYTGFM